MEPVVGGKERIVRYIILREALDDNGRSSWVPLDHVFSIAGNALSISRLLSKKEQVNTRVLTIYMEDFNEQRDKQFRLKGLGQMEDSDRSPGSDILP